MDCIFCDILDGTRNGHFLYEDDSHVAFLDKYPIDVGHSLIIPRKHHERITDMESQNVGNIFSLVPKIAKAILDVTGADAFSLGQNNGKAAKQIIPHVHVHIIPRYNHKGTIWTKRQISNDSELSELAKKIRTILI
ncbi:MAG TPA: HIT family protein [Nitrosopumilus sp.]|jgi:histidine triad (HIT) family protein|nr:HIT family protein [Nitrososphaerota archaeon]MDP6327793.1 HIT family protein [Nitrosopumilus sp.]HJL67797.1 HIT family protein [Nitrosopumilus sp.]HJM25183.1 HIT family protein [Nitrosopumilus sp.]HJO31903.1 HIT family protein [Nitrosopumilus sp.]|tara:strand:- start:2923 stop:3330 length:408 start_codon:yes stop_codon:yes gene_type:complete